MGGNSLLIMDDDEQFLLEEEVEAIANQEYKRGMMLLHKARKVPGEYPSVVKKNCPWCGGKNGYVFNSVSSWNCERCGYYPGADLLGGQFS